MMGGPVLRLKFSASRHRAHSARGGQAEDEAPGGLAERAVGLDGGEGGGTAGGAAEADGGDVDPGAVVEGGDFGEVAGLIHVPEDEGVEFAGEAGVEAVDFADQDAAPTDRPTGDADTMTTFGGQGNAGRIGIRFLAQIHLAEFHFQPRLLRDFQAVLEPFVVGSHAEDTGDERPVGGVPFPRGGEGAVQLDHCAAGLFTQEFPGHQTDFGRARGVTAGGADHGRADDVKGGVGHYWKDEG